MLENSMARRELQKTGWRGFQKFALVVFLFSGFAIARYSWGQNPAKRPDTASNNSSQLPAKWEDLTSPDFIRAIHQSQGVCLLPFGIMEKHGAHMPIGTDLIIARYASVQAAQKEYAVIFPPYYFGKVSEASHEPGAVSYPRHLQMELLQATTDEMARNGCKKIIIVNGHGGNRFFLPYFAQTQLESPHDYVIYIYEWNEHYPGHPPLHDNVDSHAGESETSEVLIARPDLVHMDRVREESGADQKRLNLPKGVYTEIQWYASFPDHYAGDASYANPTLGKADFAAWASGIAEVIRAVRADKTSLQLQNQFFEKAKHPLDTKQ
jgi:creatinine amidohydrolase